MTVFVMFTNMSWTCVLCSSSVAKNTVCAGMTQECKQKCNGSIKHVLFFKKFGAFYCYDWWYTYIHTYIHACMHAYMHTYIHNQACAQMHLQVQMRHLHLHLIALRWMHLHLHLIHPHLHLHLHLIQMHFIGIKCETNANQMRLCYCYIMYIFLVGFAWNKSQEDQYKNLWLPCLRVTVIQCTQRQKKTHVWMAFLFRLSGEIIGSVLANWYLASLSQYDLSPPHTRGNGWATGRLQQAAHVGNAREPRVA